METGTGFLVRALFKPTSERQVASYFSTFTVERHTSEIRDAPAMAKNTASCLRVDEADRARGIKLVVKEHMARDLDAVASERLGAGIIELRASQYEIASDIRAEEADLSRGVELVAKEHIARDLDMVANERVAVEIFEPPIRTY